MTECGEPGCGRASRSRGLCNTHYEYKRRRGGFEGTVPDRFNIDLRYESKVDRSGGPDACHPWTAAVNEAGYGLFRAEDRMRSAQRWAYEKYVGPLGPELVIRHTCDNPPCHNRSHWIPGTPQENTQDMIDRGRTPDRSGSKNGRSKLTEDQVREIRSRDGSAKSIAAQYGVSKSLVGMIRARQVWTHVADGSSA